MSEPEVHDRAGDPIDLKPLTEAHNRAGEPIDLKQFSRKPAVIHALLNKPRQMPDRVGKITRRPDDFPPTQQVTQVTNTTGAGTDINFSFQLEDATDQDIGPAVLIHDGEINGEVPIGMGTDEYVLTSLYDGCFINCIITYDPTSLAISSTTFEVNSEVPTSILGLLYIQIGRVYFDYDGDGNVINYVAVNTQCGDINLEFVYGSLSGAPALLPVAVYGTWVEISTLP